MTIHNLPQDIFQNKRDAEESIIFHDYSAIVGSFKGKSILHKNAISLVISGEKTMHFANTTVNIKDNEFHFLSAGNCLASVSLSKRDIFRSILVFFDNKVLIDFYLKYSKTIDRLRNGTKIKSEGYISFQKDEFIYNYIDSLSLLFKSTSKISAGMKLLKFEELMLYLLEKYPAKVLSFQSSQGKNFNDLEIRKAVEANVTNSISLEELAFLCNISLSTFKRRFQNIYGTSPSKWMLQRKMEIAKNLLQHYDEKPSEVYHKVGYESHSSFAQSFKQTYGVSPKEFQLQQLTVQQWFLS
ncbi:MAG: helix-turn-helix transcriptional regulator [Bacteroidetes bacterium]|nr:helix-turn-helix transcriptional regulator [Bacteroidota bacterium]